MSAGDFVFTHRAVRRYQPNDPWHRHVKSIRVLDRTTVRVILRSRLADWRELFSLVLPQHALAGEDLERIWFDRIDNPKTGEPIGSGPFLVERLEPGKQLTLVRNPRYWGSHRSYLDRLVLRLDPRLDPGGTAVLGALRQGEVDVALVRDPTTVSELRQIPGLNIRPIRSDGWEHLDLRMAEGGHEALRTKLVRRALAYGIDRAELARRLFGELSSVPRPSDSAAFLTSSRYYVPNWKQYSYRPAFARRLLEQAGCRRGSDEIYSCGGSRLSLDFWTTAGSGLRTRGLEIMQSQLRRVGIEAQLQFGASGALFQILGRGEFDVATFTWFVGDSIARKDLFGCGGQSNFSGYCQRLVTADLDQADRILDGRRRADVLNRVDRRLARDVPVIPLYQLPWVLAFRKNVRDVVSAPTNVLWNAENWWLER